MAKRNEATSCNCITAMYVVLHTLEHEQKKIPTEILTSRRSRAISYLEFSAALCHGQARNKHGFILEHPQAATSWRLPCMQTLAAAPNVEKVTFDQCRYGLCSPRGNLMRKRTTLMTNMPAVISEFSCKLCVCTAPHDQIVGRQSGQPLAAFGTAIPPQMVESLARCCCAA